ncbi:ABC transporter transmembrane protein [Actinokineospora cianjurensis]|uniref:ABC transporter transmembrane protein n=1 Tax=Actinokineospora cianjurensis TaxID=585224 RepID=A0A421BAV7_9PSEU|nr:ABC transporter transmembrane protein [Actinokineospora cianjurensis]
MLVFTPLSALLSAPFLAVGGVVLAMGSDVPLSGVLLVAIPVAAAVIGVITRLTTPPSRRTQVRTDAVNRVLREQITGVRVIRAFGRDAHERRRFAAANGDLMAVALRLGRLQAFSGGSALLVINLAAISVAALGGPRVVGGDLRLGALVAFLGYLTQILMAVMVAMAVFDMVPRARASADRITEVLTTEPGVPEPVIGAPLPAGPVGLAVRAVTFGYPGAEKATAREVDLVALPGQTTAIVGSTGAGKTTLVNLVARLIDVDRGLVSINGVDVREFGRRALADLVGVVPQRSYLFSGTIASNLRYGSPDATDDELWHALEVAQARDFVAAMPAGLDTPVAQGGSTVSGGQRQRLAIARALVVPDLGSTCSTTRSRRWTRRPRPLYALRLPTRSGTRPGWSSHNGCPRSDRRTGSSCSTRAVSRPSARTRNCRGSARPTGKSCTPRGNDERVPPHRVPVVRRDGPGPEPRARGRGDGGGRAGADDRRPRVARGGD